ncbi:unnamed protein product [Prunus armeniaca]
MTLALSEETNLVHGRATTLKSVASKPPREAMFVQGALNGNGPVDDPREENSTPQTQPAEELETVELSEEQPDRCVKISIALTPPLRA